jgi:hypothetical protein
LMCIWFCSILLSDLGGNHDNQWGPPYGPSHAPQFLLEHRQIWGRGEWVGLGYSFPTRPSFRVNAGWLHPSNVGHSTCRAAPFALLCWAPYPGPSSNGNSFQLLLALEYCIKSHDFPVPCPNEMIFLSISFRVRGPNSELGSYRTSKVSVYELFHQ